MITLPDGVSVVVKGKKYKGEIPAAVCPDRLKPKAKKKAKVEADESA